MKKLDIHNVAKLGERICHLCGTCVSICPVDNLKINSEQVIDKKKCINCQLCIKVCPGINAEFPEPYKEEEYDPAIGNYKQIYIGRNTKFNKKINFCAGGIVSALLELLLDKKIVDKIIFGGYSEENWYESKVKIINTKEEIYKNADSRYTYIPINSILKELDANLKYAIVGLPCHLHGIKNYKKVKKNSLENILIKIGLFCGFNMSIVATLNLLKKNNIDINELQELRYRRYGYPGGFYAKDRTKELKLSKEIYNFYNLSYVRKRCLCCIDLTSELSDISVGDCWLENYKNYSTIIARTDFGEQILDLALKGNLLDLKKQDINLIYQTHNHLLNYKKIGGNLRLKNTIITYKNFIHLKTDIKRNIIERIFNLLIQIFQTKTVKYLLYKIPDKYLISFSQTLKRIKKKYL